MKKYIGFIGLGIMGKPMAKNLVKGGYSLIVFDVVDKAMEEMAVMGIAVGKSPKDVTEKSDIVFTVLPNSPEVKTVVLGKDGIIEGAHKDTILVDMSSIDPMVSIEIAKVLEARSVNMLDEPVSGGEQKAIDGSLAIMVGGLETVFTKVEPLLKVMGGSVTLVGKIGSGNIAKLANQIMVAANIAGMSEAMVLATKAGVDPEKVFKAVRVGLAGSTVLDSKMPMILDGNFNPGFRIELHVKDLKNVLDAGHALGTPLFLSSMIHEMMEVLIADGKSKNDHGGLIQFYEDIAKIQVRRK